MSEVLVSRGTLLNALAYTFRIPQPDGDKALTSRVRLLGTLGIPRRGRGDRNAHMQYRLVDAAEIAVALALINAHMSPALAARYVKEQWGPLASLSLSGMLSTIPGQIRDLFKLQRAGPIAFIEGNVMSTLGHREVRESLGEIMLAPVELFQDAARLAVRVDGCDSATVIDARRFMQRLLSTFLAFSPPLEDLESMLNQLRDAGEGRAASH